MGEALDSTAKCGIYCLYHENRPTKFSVSFLMIKDSNFSRYSEVFQTTRISIHFTEQLRPSIFKDIMSIFEYVSRVSDTSCPRLMSFGIMK